MQDQKVQFTQEGLDKIKKEHVQLSKIKRPVAVDRLQKARAMGDLSENSEYSAAKEDLDFLTGRIAELEHLMKNAVIVANDHHTTGVDIGSVITVESHHGQEKFTIVGEFEADPIAKKLSQTSPIGKALLGKKVGEQVEVKIPVGTIIYKIIDIQKN